jgi:hypothetical protein
MALDAVAIGLDHLHAYLAFVPRRRSMRLSEQLAADCAAGCKWAKRVAACRILADPSPTRPARSKRPAPVVPVKTKNQLAAEQRSAAIVRRLERESGETGVSWQYVGSHRDSLYVEKRSAKS